MAPKLFVLIRWARTPKWVPDRSACGISELLLKSFCNWHITHWVSSLQIGDQYLTAILLSYSHSFEIIVGGRRSPLLEILLKHIQHRWMGERVGMVWEQAERVCNPQLMHGRDWDSSNKNLVSMWEPGCDLGWTFCDQVCEAERMLTDLAWSKLLPDVCCTQMDTVSSARLSVKSTHRHSHVLLIGMSPLHILRRVTVTCTEPQTIYELFGNHNEQPLCVWTESGTNVSPTAPCTALVDLNVQIVRVENACWEQQKILRAKADAYTGEPVKQLLVKARRGVFKDIIDHGQHKDSHLHLSTVEDQTEPQSTNEDEITVLLCARGTDMVCDVLREDVRFIDDVELVDLDRPTVNTKRMYIMNLCPGDNYMLQEAKDKDEGELDEYTCYCCLSQVISVQLPCGHACCKNCYENMNNCGKCRAIVQKREASTFTVPNDTEKTCSSCNKKREWVSNTCTHLVCPCLNRCTSCAAPLAKIRRLFL